MSIKTNKQYIKPVHIYNGTGTLVPDPVRLANFKAGIKPTAPLLAFDKENSIEFLLDFVHYLYIKSNPNPSFYLMLPYESLSSCTSINKKIKEMKMKRNIK